MPTFSAGVLTHKVGQTHLGSGVRLGFISKSVHARLQVSLFSDYDLFQPGWLTSRRTRRHADRHTDNILTSLYE